MDSMDRSLAQLMAPIGGRSLNRGAPPRVPREAEVAQQQQQLSGGRAVGEAVEEAEIV